jgi:O-antigen ligase
MPQVFFFTDDQYLGSLIETGVLGLTALLALFAIGWFIARSARRVSIDEETRHLAQALAAPMAIVFVTYATFDAFAFPMAAGLTFLMAGCTGAIWRLARAQATIADNAEQDELALVKAR